MPIHNLSEPVRRAIALQQSSAEIIIHAIQTGVVGFLGILYFLAPKGINVQGGFEPVPLVLAIYFPWLLFRLFLAWKHRLGGWLNYVGCATDVGIMALLIWSYHIQYGQPPAFYLKAPSFLYFFLFVALASLRYHPASIVFVGTLSALAWSFLVGYALLDDGVSRTRLFSEYGLADKVLVGAEVDKLMTLGLVTVILAVAVHRSRKLLAESLINSHMRRQYQRFFSPEVAERILNMGRLQPGYGEIHAMVTVFIDIRGFTELSERLNPNELMGLLTDYQSLLVRAVQECGGTVDKFMGDGILVHFTSAGREQRYVADCLRMVDRIFSDVVSWNVRQRAEGKAPLRIGLGCCLGENVFGVVGSEGRLEFTVIGKSVNTAAKLEKFTKQAGAECVMTAETYRLALDQGYEPVRPVLTLGNRVVEGLPSAPALVGIPLDLPAQSLHGDAA